MAMVNRVVQWRRWRRQGSYYQYGQYSATATMATLPVTTPINHITANISPLLAVTCEKVDMFFLNVIFVITKLTKVVPLKRGPVFGKSLTS